MIRHWHAAHNLWRFLDQTPPIVRPARPAVSYFFRLSAGFRRRRVPRANSWRLLIPSISRTPLNCDARLNPPLLAGVTRQYLHRAGQPRILAAAVDFSPLTSRKQAIQPDFSN